METTTINESIERLEVPLKNSSNGQEYKVNRFEAKKNIERKNPKETDSWIYRIIVMMLGFSIILIIAALFVLTLNGSNIKENQLITIFATISSGAIGALAGLLTPSPKK
ncbi:hypothetical protein [Chryseobacterium sp. MMS23-Vi53]|uniref:hypothetical protein n=1 Tax=Chryseobacterium sp. MMS23-Vi53 TaxID=3386644 RepID=UPI0039ED457D